MRGATQSTRTTRASVPSCSFFFHRNGRFALTQSLHYHSRGRKFFAIHGRFYEPIIRGPEICESDHGSSHECFDSCSVALAQLVENTHQREFDKMFNAIPIYDGENPDKFEPWLKQLQNACRVGKRNIWEVAMCCTSGPVLEVLQSMDPVLGWSKIHDELWRCFSPNRTSPHATALLIAFCKQNKNKNLRSFIYQYMKLHAQATGMSPKDDYDLMQKVEFLKRLHNKFIGNKIIRSNAFKSYTTFSMADCFSKVLELEGEYQVGEVVSPGMDLHIMSATGQLTGEEVHEANTSGDTELE